MLKEQYQVKTENRYVAGKISHKSLEVNKPWKNVIKISHFLP
jgi:hypothetical protein